MTIRACSIVFVLIAAVCGPAAAAGAPSTAASGTAATGRPADAVRDALAARLGPGAQIEIVRIDGADDALAIRAVRLDPGARLGRTMRVVMTTARGASISASVTLRVTADRLVARHPIAAGATITAEDIDVTRAVVEEEPIRHLLTPAEAVGARTRRAIPAGTTLADTDLVPHRAVEAGDRVTAIAAEGPVTVSGIFIAAEGGRVGDVIRVTNPDTHRYLRARIARQGVVEVTHAH